MSKISQKISTTLAASAVVIGLSGCSMINTNPDSRMGRANAAIGTTGAKIWKRTKHVFRISDDETVVANRSVDPDENNYEEYKDQVDLALMEADQPELIPTQELESDISQEIAVATPTLATEQPAMVEIPASASAPEKVEQVLARPQSLDDATIRDLTLRSDDYTHVVAENESLWTLSKSLTGDANNWRILAELNNLDENGSIFPGQTLHIPADMAVGSGVPTIATKEPMAEKPAKVAAVAKQETMETTVIIPKTEKVPVADKAKSLATDTVAEIAIADAAPAEKGPSTLFGVQAGETMWDLAKRSTGDATNWKAIAAANDMTEQEAGLIRYGQKIAIPNSLLKSGASAAADIKTPKTDSTVEAVAIKKTDEAKPAAQAALAATAKKPVKIPQAQAKQPAEESLAASEQPLTEEIEILPAKINPVMAAANSEASTDNTQPAASQNEDWVMVSGTYYPKAVYNDANFSASLLMRVSPGTKLLVSKAVGPWFEVKTDRGIGYVHSRDIK